ncbi:putative TRm2011-2 protein (plasmid) [Sinorhizobium meliloti 1021]|nr:ORFC [Sinorhizobium meliloti]AGG71295.1 Putative TRm2011-2 protein [Sinorhizobium meliloti 2011]CAC48695.1 putative TRm2011-2 protein [Sinorhizobium meliloti 1021]
MGAEIVQDDDVAGFEFRHQNLLDIDAEAFAIDRAIEDKGSADAVGPECGDKGHGVPMAEGGVAHQSFAARRPAPQRRHVRLRPGLIDENEAGGINSGAVLQPSCPVAGDVGPLPFAGDQRLFL